MQKPREIIACIFRWNWLLVRFQSATIAQCCKTDHLPWDPNTNAGFLNDPAIVESRRNLLSGVRDAGCGQCWKSEQSGVASFRQSFDGTKQFKESQYLGSTNGLSLGADWLEIMLDDVCNMECMYCDSVRSTTWQTRIGVKSPPAALSDQMRSQFWPWYESAVPRLKHISISGGEPLLSPSFDALITKTIDLLKLNPKKGHVVSVLTNLSYPRALLAKKIPLLLELAECCELFIEFSNESIGEKARYIRFPLDWARFSGNLELLMTYAPRLRFAAQTTLSAICMSSLAEYWKYLNSLQERFNCEIYPVVNIVNEPRWLNPGVLCNENSLYLDEILREIEVGRARAVKSRQSWDTYLTMIASLREGMFKLPDAERIQLRTELAERIKWLDSARATRFEETFPEYAHILSAAGPLERIVW